MPTISVPSPVATFAAYGVLICLCSGQLIVNHVVPARYGRRAKRAALAAAGWGSAAERDAAQAWWAERCSRLEAEAAQVEAAETWADAA
jgi:hypothetical protein